MINALATKIFFFKGFKYNHKKFILEHAEGSYLSNFVPPQTNFASAFSPARYQKQYGTILI